MGTIAYKCITKTRVVIRGAGEQASGIAHCLFKCGFKVCMLDTDNPVAVRRMVAFCEAVYDSEKTVEEVTAICVRKPEEIFAAWEQGKIPLLIDPENNVRHFLKPHVVVDAILAKRNMGTRINDAPLVLALGPGFQAGRDAHIVIETKRGHHLGRLIFIGEAEPNTGVPGTIGGFSKERVLRAPCKGIFNPCKNIGDLIGRGELIARVGDQPITSEISGVIRGMLRSGTHVRKGLKAGDVDPRGEISYCSTISEKSRALGGAVTEAILSSLPGRLTPH